MTDVPAAERDLDSMPIGWATILLPPLIAIGLLIAVLFAPILSVQATEIARLVQEAEIDLTSMLYGYPPTGSFMELLPKIILFNVLLLAWVFVANVTTFSLSERLASPRSRTAIAIFVSSSLVAVLLAKYWVANWRSDYWAGVAQFQEPLGMLNVVVNHVPALASGGIWIFSILLLIEVVVLQWYLARQFLLRPYGMKAGLWVPVMLFLSIAVFVAGALVTIYAPFQIANRLGTINIVVLYVVLLYSFLAGVLYYLHTRWGMRVISVAAIYLVVINLYGSFIAPDAIRTPRILSTTSQAAPARSEDAFTAWFANRTKNPASAEPFPVFVIAAAGGGMRATLRTAFFLEHIRVTCPAFLHHTFAISSVSGGALGALLAVAQGQIPSTTEKTQCNLSAPTLEGGGGRLLKSAPLMEEFVSTDIIPAIVGAGLFAELFQRLLPPGVLPYFDRSMAVRNEMASNWANAVDRVKGPAGAADPSQGTCKLRDFLSHCDSNSYWHPAGNTPLLVFNATSATDGGLVPLSNVDPNYFTPLPLSQLSLGGAGPARPFSFELLSGAITSARFPIALPGAPYRDSSGSEHYVVDGGYFDNSGLLVARAIKKRIEDIVKTNNEDAQKTPISAKVYIIYLHETDGNKMLCDTVKAASGAPMEVEAAPFNAELAHVNALFSARDKLSAMNYALLQELDTDSSIIDFDWDLYIPPASPAGSNADGASSQPIECGKVREYAPLAFYYAPSTRQNFFRFLEGYLLGENAADLARLQKLLQP
ncbi:MAG: hypothetical protein AB7O43_01760 [Hyphomicrobiaceae bacterium]